MSPGKRNIIVKSNDEVGMGRADIIVKNKAKRCVVIFELKKALPLESPQTS